MASGGGNESGFARLVMDLSLRTYSRLPRKGKPKEGEEWTPLATILCCEGIYVHLWNIRVMQPCMRSLCC